MSVLVVLSTQAKSGRAEDVKAFFKEILVDTRAFDGCEGVTVYQDQDDPSSIVLIETWENRAKYEVYGAWRGQQRDPRMAELFGGPPSFKFYDIADA